VNQSRSKYLVRCFHFSAICCSIVDENQRNFLYVVIVPPVAVREDLTKKGAHSAWNVIASRGDHGQRFNGSGQLGLGAVSA